MSQYKSCPQAQSKFLCNKIYKQNFLTFLAAVLTAEDDYDTLGAKVDYSSSTPLVNVTLSSLYGLGRVKLF